MTSIAPRLALLLLAGLVLATGCASPGPGDRSRGAGTAAVLHLSAPPADWNALAGRRVHIDAPLQVSGNRDLVRDGELLASFDGRLWVPTEHHLPGADAMAAATDNARRRVRLVEARESGVADTGWPLSPPWRSGSELSGVEGVVESDRRGLLLRVDRPLQARPAPRPAPPRVPGDVRLASLNLENLFNGDGRGGGFPTSRGARTQDEYLRQRAKLVASLRALDADIVALMELENDGEGPLSSLAQLVAALDAGAGDWRFVPACAAPCVEPPNGAHPIRVGMIYRASRVTAIGQAHSLAGGPFGERSRGPLAQTFRAGDGPAFTVVAVHLKSKGCSEATGEDADQGDGQACWNATRLESVRRLDSWLRIDGREKFGELLAIVGDFNAYAMEDPLRLLRASGWRDALDGVATPYSYVYAGEAGRLDHALLSPALATRLVGASEWHSNADEAEIVGYRAGIGTEAGATPWRSSDHDPLLLGLRLRAR
jgi:uncharacterized protein